MADQENKKDKKNTKKGKNAPVQLFSKFGEFNSVEELNEAAAGQLAEGDIEALKVLAEENGIEEADVQDYIDGYTDTLAMPITAALGRLRVEEENVINKWTKNTTNGQKKVPCKVIIGFVRAMVTEKGIAEAVMKKGKRVEKIEDLMYQERCNSGTDKDMEEIIRAYYLEGEKKVKEKIEEIKGRYE